MRNTLRTFVSVYDELAPYFRAYSEERAPYLGAVDAIVLASLPRGARSMLDVGAGDGVRAARIARSRALSFVVADPSAAMLERSRTQGATASWVCSAEELPDTNLRFDVITCLWNVLGHVPGRSARVKALSRMCALLAPGGSIFLDVNNRYNARSYGWFPTLRRALRDLVQPSERNGDAALTWSIGNVRIPAHTHFFTPRELHRLVHDARLRIKRRWIVDYRTGALRRFVFEGQLLCELVPREGT